MQNVCPQSVATCTCPHTSCPNWGRCCACVEAHRSRYSLTMCMKIMLKEKEENGIQTVNPHLNKESK
ncbi:MAG: hypothetical protein LBP26_07770 [Clostridiales bacterium]|nr:hypothetical protein [Clostridiales bacterium]